MQIVIDIPIVVYDEIINFNDANNTALYEAIRNGTPLPKEHGWIPISEGLPEDRQRLLVTVVRYSGDKITRLAEYYSRNNGKGIFQIQENHEEWEVGEKGLLAWMPLPEPYKEVSE